MSAPMETRSGRLGEIVQFFLRLGLTAFGGPAAHLMLMEREAVERRGWLSREQFLDLVGACNLLPGPGSTQVAMALGYRRRGWPGLIVAGVCFIVPACLATLALAWAYVRFGSVSWVQGLLYGAKPVMVAILLQAIWNLGRTAFRRWSLGALGVAALAAAWLGAPPIAVLLASGGVLLCACWAKTRFQSTQAIAFLPAAAAAGTATASASLASVALLFLKLGVVVFGSGYVLLAFLKADLVDRLHWITEPQLIDAVTAGQITPGPVFATATFVGFLLHGWPGAAVATVSIFLPSFVMAGMVGALAGRIRQSELAAAFLDGVNAAAVAVMAAVAWPLGRAAIVDGSTAGIGFAGLILLLVLRINATWVVLLAALLGALLRGLQ